MPNWCQNVATIYHEDKQKIDAIRDELSKPKDDVALFNSLRPRPADQEENWYSWNLENWGTKWEASVYDFDRIDEHNIKVSYDTAWGPSIAFYEFLDSEGYEVDAFYHEEGMAFCGRYAYGTDDHYEYSNMDSSEILDEIPYEIDEMFCISEMMQERESEDDDLLDEEDSKPEQSQYEMTDWFAGYTPAQKGVYEVKTKSWPFPQKAEWKKNKWFTLNTDTQKYSVETNPALNDVVEWRGLTEEGYKEAQLALALKELKEEFEKLEITE